MLNARLVPHSMIPVPPPKKFRRIFDHDENKGLIEKDIQYLLLGAGMHCAVGLIVMPTESRSFMRIGLVEDKKDEHIWMAEGIPRCVITLI